MTKDRTSLFLPMKDLNVLIAQGPQNGLRWLSVDEMLQLGIDSSALFLGLLDRVACFVVDISDHEHAVRELTDGGAHRFVDARTVTEFLSGTDSGIVAQARSQVNWHNRNGFCSICGQETFIKRCGSAQSVKPSTIRAQILWLSLWYLTITDAFSVSPVAGSRVPICIRLWLGLLTKGNQ